MSAGGQYYQEFVRAWTGRTDGTLLRTLGFSGTVPTVYQAQRDGLLQGDRCTASRWTGLPLSATDAVHPPQYDAHPPQYDAHQSSHESTAARRAFQVSTATVPRSSSGASPIS
ncbi:hypothetical protein [Kitasatospora purpeofusca]|uniref:hypothetical protein n=1 Tax=Kitasatospora purpeofusca TaxID=67352 RepID=UPI0039904432